ncbi:S1/P1 nuclease [Aliiglaciecola litoralis]|uniref:S1/P1 nuclease n=1 Tax=Aliiglaciecola litoralis TaxID=582857 RepID=A0ABN1LIB1_9ALTE
MNTRFKQLLQLSAAALLVTSSSQALAWGQIGHRVTGEIAELYLDADTREKIAALFPNQSLAELSTQADSELSNPSEFWQQTWTWHFVTVPEGNEYSLDKHAPKEGDAYTALTSSTETLKDPKATVEEKRIALLFIVHLIGDLHQPLHSGNGTDRGGNDVKVEFFWQPSNLHRVWDSGIIDNQNLSYTELTKWLSQKITPQMASEWRTTDPKTWIKESIIIRDGIYPEEPKLTYDYQYQHIATIKQRLQQAGVRMAAYLNEVL